MEAFGKFGNIMRSDDQLDPIFYETAAFLMVEMSKEFSDEVTRLRAFFSSRMTTTAVPSDFPLPLHFTEMGGVAMISDTVEEFYVANWEFKNEMLGISSEPTFENEYFVHLQKGYMAACQCY